MVGNTPPSQYGDSQAEGADTPTETSPQEVRRKYRYDPLRDLAMFTLSRCPDSAPSGPYGAYMSQEDALDVVLAAQPSAPHEETRGDN